MNRLSFARKCINHFKRQTPYYATAGILAVTCIPILPQTLGVSWYRDVLAVHQDGAEKPLSADQVKQCQALIEQVDMNASEELNFGFFLSNTMDVISIGSGKCSSGVLVGVPYFFNYNKRDDVETERLKVSHTKIDWESPAAKELIDSFVLSDCAKNYAILRQIYQGNTYGAYSSGALGTILGYLSYVSGSALRHHYKLEYVLKTPARVMVYAMVAVVWACLYVTLKDMITCRRETIGDRFACNHGHGMWRGGLEYYNKQINRHKALRELMGGEGPGVYTAGGNYVQAAIRKPHLDITQRRDFIQRKMDNYEEFVKEHENVFKQLEENS